MKTPRPGREPGPARARARVRGGRGERRALALWLALLVVASSAAPGRVGAATPREGGGHHRPQQACPNETVAYKVSVAERVFEGRVKSKSAVDKGMYNVTFGVMRVHKGDRVDLESQRTQGVRLQFLHKSASSPPSPPSSSSSSSSSSSNQQTLGCEGAGGVVRAIIRPAKRYIVFVDRVAPHVFRARAEPVVKTHQNVQAVKEAVSCGAAMRLELKDVEVTERSKLKLKCIVRPTAETTGKLDRTGLKLSWYKDGARLEHSKRSRIRINKKQQLNIVDVKVDDAGMYVCRAQRSKCSYEASARVKVNREMSRDIPGICTIDSFCLNGGTCLYFRAYQEMSCVCEDGFKGQRCEVKDVRFSGNEDEVSRR